MLKVGILGAAGYTGAELVRLIAQHPEFELARVSARENAGRPLCEVQPATSGVQGLGELVLETFDTGKAQAWAEQLDVVFLALPHGASARFGQALFSAGARVVDLSADFRLRSVEDYARAYGEHPCPELLERAVYGLVELHRAELPGARLIAAPGCYPTSAILPLSPLLRDQLVEPDGIIIDAKSGVSGAGRTPGPATHFPQTAEGVRPYKVAGAHRHLPEIEQELSREAGRAIKVVFTPQLVPMSRGILSIAYARAKNGTTLEMCREAARRRFEAGLVSVLGDGLLPDTLWVRGSARAHVAYELDARTRTVLAMCAIDNLSRGASAQAIQALNVALGLPDALGLPQVGLYP